MQPPPRKPGPSRAASSYDFRSLHVFRLGAWRDCTFWLPGATGWRGLPAAQTVTVIHCPSSPASAATRALAASQRSDDPIFALCHCGPATFFPESERTGPPVGGQPHSTARALLGGRERGGHRRLHAVTRLMSTKALWTKLPHSGESGSQSAVSRMEQLRLRLLSAVSRNQAGARV